MDYDAWALDVERQLRELADRRTFRFRATRRVDAAAYLAAMRAFEGLSEDEIAAVEKSLGFDLPSAYRAFLRRFGRARGELFRGSDFEPRDLVKYRVDAEALIVDEEPLPTNAIVFIFHQGYTFCWLADDDDPPVMQFVEGEGTRQCAERFTTFIDAEVALMKQLNATAHESGGTYLTASGGLCEVYPARSEGVRPIDEDDELL